MNEERKREGELEGGSEMRVRRRREGFAQKVGEEKLREEGERDGGGQVRSERE